MDFNSVVATRRSIRKFKPLEVEQDNIFKIIEYGIYAPSAHNRQPWKVKILRGDEKNLVTRALMKKSDLDPSISNTARIIEEAPVLLVIFYDKSEGSRDNDILSIGAFIENMHLKCTEMGLGSLWIANTNYIKDDISKITKVSLECVSCLAIGWPNQSPNMRPRKALEDIIIQ